MPARGEVRAREHIHLYPIFPWLFIQFPPVSCSIWFNWARRTGFSLYLKLSGRARVVPNCDLQSQSAYPGSIWTTPHFCPCKMATEGIGRVNVPLWTLIWIWVPCCDLQVILIRAALSQVYSIELCHLGCGYFLSFPLFRVHHIIVVSCAVLHMRIHLYPSNIHLHKQTQKVFTALAPFACLVLSFISWLCLCPSLLALVCWLCLFGLFLEFVLSSLLQSYTALSISPVRHNHQQSLDAFASLSFLFTFTFPLADIAIQSYRDCLAG